ncbi:MAG TPA: polyamine aminopropyltransferase [Clostridiales bacterium]|nr:polyamine aminopropyltransferase [Clostridiales bacterium]
MELWFTEEHTPNVRFTIKIDKHIHSEQSPFQRIDFFDSYEFGRFFALDGIVMLTEKDEFIYHEMIVHVPMAVNPNIKKVLVIGGGDGGTVRELTRYGTVESIEMVEIDQRVVECCREFLPLTSSKLDDPRVKLLFEDGIKYVSTKQNEYDLIIVDSTDPIGPGEGLFTEEFYKNCYNALNEEGILVNQHESVYYDNTTRLAVRTHKRIKKFFPIAKVYQAAIPTYGSGYWLFGFASKKYDPIKDFDDRAWNELGLDTKYYNTELHKGAFALPNYVIETFED